jgi:NCS2 family nucleobase:cation symporter-2
MTAFLFSSVAVSGLRIIASVEFTRRNRFILTASFSLGMGVTLVPEWFGYFFTYSGDNHALEGLLNACDLVMENGFAVAALLGIFLNLFIPEEADDLPAVLDSTDSEDGRTQVDTTTHESTTKLEHPVAPSASA